MWNSALSWLRPDTIEGVLSILVDRPQLSPTVIITSLSLAWSRDPLFSLLIALGIDIANDNEYEYEANDGGSNQHSYLSKLIPGLLIIIVTLSVRLVLIPWLLHSLVTYLRVLYCCI